MANANTKMALSGLTILMGETVVAATHAGGVGAIVALVAGAVVYNAISDVEQATGKDTPSLPVPTLPRRQQVPGQPSLAYRLLNGKSTREPLAPAFDADSDNRATHYSKDDFPDDFNGSRLDGSGAFTFSELLATGWRPSYNQIFLARLEDGRDIFITVEQAVHIALAGATRQGKTSLIRQLLLQLCYVGCCCFLLDPHYTPYDIETGEDWTPFTPFLRFNPLECKSYDRIEQILRHAATTLLEKRKVLREQMKPVGASTFFFIDELPAIIAEKPDVQKYIAKLLREGGKYKLYLCTASQDYQVKTISPQSGGAIRDNYKTCFYVGGDATTARVLLDTEIARGVEAMLGKGSIYLRCETHKQASLAQTPFTDNQALYQLLGPSTYQPFEESDSEESGTYAAFDEDALQQPQIHQVQASKLQQKVYEPIPLPEAISAADKVADEKIANILRAQSELLEIGDARLTKALREQGYGKEATQYRVGRMKKLVRDELDELGELGELGDVEPETEGE